MADDILLHASTVEEHDQRLHALLKRLSDLNLTLNPRKCSFRMRSIKFLGFIVSDQGVSPDPDKVKSIVGFQAPKSASECRSFMGLVNFVGKFVPDLATVSEPIRRLMVKDAAFVWGGEQQEAFCRIKELMSKSETLAHFDPKHKTKLVADASPFGLGAVLIQEQNGNERVIAYGHRSLSTIERKYSQTEREALALVWSCEHFMLYLLGTEFELVTDHKPLQFIFNNPSSKPVPRIERWSLRLQAFKYKVVYMPGAGNIADPLSRMVGNVIGIEQSCVAAVVGDRYAREIAKQSVPKAISWDEIVSHSEKCREIQFIITALANDTVKSCSRAYQAVALELSQVDGVLLRGNNIVIPVSLREHIISLAHEGHQGIVKTKQRLRSKVWWPGIVKQAELVCSRCIDCMTVSMPQAPQPLSMTKFPEKPWSFLSADLLGPLPNGQSIIVMVDYYSRYFECAFLNGTKSENVIEFMDTVFTRFGYCDSIRTDNGPQFASELFQSYLTEHDIKWLSTTPLWPQANGEVERINRTLLKVLKIAHGNNQNLGRELRRFLQAYRSTPHSSTGVTPFTLLFGRQMKTKLPALDVEPDPTVYEKARENDAQSKVKNKSYADEKRAAKEPDIQVGDSVLMRKEKKGKLDANYSKETHVVVSKQGSEVTCENQQGKTIRRNSTFVKVVPTAGVSETDACQPNVPDGSQEAAEAPISLSGVSVPQRRSPRCGRPPDRFGDYVVHALVESTPTLCA